MKENVMRTLVCLLTLLCSHWCGATPVSSDQASTAVGNWLGRRHQLGCRLGTAVSETRTCLTTNGVPFHVVTIDGGGFVVTSSDTENEPIVAFSESTNLVESASNPLWVLLNRDFSARKDVRKSLHMATAGASSGSAESDTERKWASLLPQAAAGAPVRKLLAASGSESISDVRVAPLLKTLWSQRQDSYYSNRGDPCYNYYTPKNYPCGCVATATAQIMRYHRHPAAAVEPGTYDCKVNRKKTELTMQGGVYAWADMPEVPADGTTLAQRQAIGKLTSDVGIACLMEYGSSGSSAAGYMASKALTERFQYANAVAYAGDRLPMATVKSAVIPNLDAKLPVLLGVDGSGGGHAVVADGYGYSMETFYMHINMGWAGLDDAWYAPPDMGDYSSVDSVVCNIIASGVTNGVICSGRVLSAETGRRLAAQTVTASDGVESFETTTDANGIYAFVLKAGRYRIASSGATLDVTLKNNVGTEISDDGYYYMTQTVMGNRHDCNLEVSSGTPPATTYAVTFDLGAHGTRTGGGALTQTVEEGAAATAPEFTVADGWQFTGWDTSFDAVTADLTVTAQYEEAPDVEPEPIDWAACDSPWDARDEAVAEGKLMFVLSGADWCPWTTVVKEYLDDLGAEFTDCFSLYYCNIDTDTYGMANGAPSYGVFVPEMFDGNWSDGRLSYNSGGVASRVQAVLDEALELSAASWTISYDLGGGANATNNPTAYGFRDEVVLAAPTREGYVFLGWEPDDGVIERGSTGDRSFTAAWEENANPGSGELPDGGPYRQTVGGYTWTFTVDDGCAIIGSVDANGYTAYEKAISPLPRGHVTVPAVLGGRPVTEIGYAAFLNCSGLESVTLPDSVVNIGWYAFANCKGLGSFEILAGVEKLGSFCFNGCSSLTNLTVATGNASFAIEDGFLLTADLKTVLLGLPTQSGTVLRIPDGVEEIGSYAFYGSAYESVEIPTGVSEIGYAAFESCRNLGCVVIPASVGQIGAYAFGWCYSLTNVTFAGDAPAVDRPGAAVLFQGSSSVKIFVSRTSSGWDVEIPGTWQGCPIDYLEAAPSEPTVYAITYDLAGGVNAAGNPTSYAFGESVTLEDPTRKGYVFAGWRPGGMVVAGSTGDRMFTATWEMDWEAYDSPWDARDEAVAEGKLMFVLSGADWCGWTGVVKDYIESLGAEFFDFFTLYYCNVDTDKYDMADGVPSYGVFDPSAFDGNWYKGCLAYGSGGVAKRVQAVLDKAKAAAGLAPPVFYTVTFDLGEHGTRTGGGALEQSVAAGEAATAPEVATPDGWWLMGWDTLFDMVTGDMTAKAIYEEYVPGTRAGSWTTDAAGAKAAADGRLAVVLLSNYGGCAWSQEAQQVFDDPVFLSWAASNGVYLVTADESNLPVGCRDAEDAGNWFWRLFSSWSKRPSYIEYPTIAVALSSNPNQAIGLDVVRDDGTRKVGGVAYDGTVSALVDGLSVYLAKSPKPQVTVTFNANGGKSAEKSRKVELGAAIGSLPEVTRAGYDFEGWFADKTGDEAVTADAVATASMTLHARWSAVVYGISYELGGGENAEANPSTYTIESEMISLQPPTREGFWFVGWTPKGVIPAGSTGDKTFRASWSEVGLARPAGSSAVIPAPETTAGGTVKWSAKGLPAGMKIAAKDLTDKTLGEIPAGTIYGTPTKPGEYVVTVTAKGDTTETFEIPITVANFTDELVPVADRYGTYRVGAKTTLDLGDFADCKVSGLPAGLKFAAKAVKDKTFGDVAAGTVYGVPTKACTNVVTFTRTVGTEKHVASATFVVAGLPAWAVGTFNGRLDDGSGSVTLTVAAAGKASGKVVSDGKTWSFSAPGFEPADESADAVEVLELAAEAKSGKDVRAFSVVVTDGISSGTFGDAAPLTLWRNGWKDKGATDVLKGFVGLYTVQLECGETGTGYLSLTLDAKGGCKAAGKLPDGTKASGTLPLAWVEEAGAPIAVWQLAPSAYKGGCVGGLLRWEGGESSFSPLTVTAADVVWISHAPGTTDEYGAGFERTLSAHGAWYDKLATLSGYYSTLAFAADAPTLDAVVKTTDYEDDKRVTTSETMGIDAAALECWGTLTLSLDGKGTGFAVDQGKATKPAKGCAACGTGDEWSYAGANDAALAFGFTKATGIFKGSFTCWYDYVSATDNTREPAKETVTHASKKVSYEGVMVLGEALRGFYLWDRTGTYEDEKSGNAKTYKYKESRPVAFE